MTGAVRDRRRQAGEQVEKRRLRPLDVVDDDHERPVAGAGREEGRGSPRPSPPRSCRPVGERRAAARSSSPTADALRRRRRRAPRCSARASSGECSSLTPGQLAHDLADRPVGDSLAVREARAADDPGPCSDPRDELRHETRLAHARLADDVTRPAAPEPRRPPPSSRSSSSSCSARPVNGVPTRRSDRPEVGDLEQAVGGHGLRLSLRAERLDRPRRAPRRGRGGTSARRAAPRRALRPARAARRR